MPVGIGQFIGNNITTLTRPDAFAPVIGLEGVVVAGRTKKAHDRGGKEEARERIIEESTGSVVWLGGVKTFNKIGDKVITYFLGNKKNADVDTGMDALRKPFENFLNNNAYNPKGFSEKALSRMKFAKVATSVILANSIMGFIVPPLNHKLTEKLRKQKQQNQAFLEQKVPSRFNSFATRLKSRDENDGNVNFKGGLNPVINFVENTTVGSLISTDVGVIGGRTLNARRKEEGAEIVIRDGGSVYFYMFAQPHVRALLNKAESGRWTRLDPASVNITHNQLANMFTEQTPTMTVEEFRKRAFGKTDTGIDLNKFFGEKEEVINIDKFNSIEKNLEIQARALDMSKLQPQQRGVSILSREQVADVYREGELNSPKFLKAAYEDFTEGKSSNPHKFVSMEKLSKHKQEIYDYVSDICKKAEKNGGIVDLKLLKTAKRNNLILSGLNFAAGFSFASLFLAKLIPTFQYWVTKKMTGVDAFPGTYDYEKNNSVKVNQKA